MRDLYGICRTKGYCECGLCKYIIYKGGSTNDLAKLYESQVLVPQGKSLAPAPTLAETMRWKREDALKRGEEMNKEKQRLEQVRRDMNLALFAPRVISTEIILTEED